MSKVKKPSEILNELYLSGDRGNDPVFSIDMARTDLKAYLFSLFDDIGSELHPQEVISIIDDALPSTIKFNQSSGQLEKIDED